MLSRARIFWVSAVAIFALLVGVGVPAQAAEVPVSEPPVEVNEQPALPAGEAPEVVASVPEGSFDAPTE